jgi:hypothetical protein
MKTLRIALFGGCSALAMAAAAQPAITGPIDPMAFSQLKDFTAHRSSSNWPDDEWNDDSKHPLPGEVLTIADLKGPGIVTHIWTTVSGTEYGWPRLLRLRVYYDGSPTPSVDAPLGVANEGSRRVGLYYHLPAPADGKPWVFLDTQGRGFYIGTVLSIIQAEPG